VLRPESHSRQLLEKDLKPRDIMTFKAFENAITIVMILADQPMRFCI
jgi:dihydroxy-acid dehydratase